MLRPSLTVILALKSPCSETFNVFHISKSVDRKTVAWRRIVIDPGRVQVPCFVKVQRLVDPAVFLGAALDDEVCRFV